MKEETVINQQAQEHAAACTLFARLLGQLAPAFIRLPVLDKNLHEPSQGMALDNIECAPGQVRGNEITIGLFAFILDGHNKAFGFMGTDIQPCTADQGYDPGTTTDTDGMRGAGMGGKIVCHRLLPFMHADFLVAAYLRDDLHATEQRRGGTTKGAVP
jgi:hypothetical protein